MARPKVGDLIPIGAIGSAKSDDVLEGKTYSSDEGVDLEGTMPNRGAINRTITTQGGKIIVPEGYHDGRGIVKAQFANLIASNIRKGIRIGGVLGTFSELTNLKFHYLYDSFNDLPKSFYVPGEIIFAIVCIAGVTSTGGMPPNDVVYWGKYGDSRTSIDTRHFSATLSVQGSSCNLELTNKDIITHSRFMWMAIYI